MHVIVALALCALLPLTACSSGKKETNGDEPKDQVQTPPASPAPKSDKPAPQLIKWPAEDPEVLLGAKGISVSGHLVDSLLTKEENEERNGTALVRTGLQKALLGSRAAIEAAIADGTLDVQQAGAYSIRMDPSVPAENLLDVLLTATNVGFQRFTVEGGGLEKTPTLYARSPRAEDRELPYVLGVMLFKDRGEAKAFFRLGMDHGPGGRDAVVIGEDDLPKLGKKAKSLKRRGAFEFEISPADGTSGAFFLKALQTLVENVGDRGPIIIVPANEATIHFRM